MKTGILRRLLYAAAALLLLLIAACGSDDALPDAPDRPQIGVENFQDGAIVPSSFTLPLRISSSRNIVSIRYRIDTRPFETLPVEATPEIPISGLAGGPHNLTVIAEDSAGQTATLQRSFIVDATPPLFQSIRIQGQERVNAIGQPIRISEDTDLRINIVATDNIDARPAGEGTANLRIEVRLNGEALQAQSSRGELLFTVPAPLLTRGVNDLEIIARDAVENTTVANFEVVVTGTTTPVITILSPAEATIVAPRQDVRVVLDLNDPDRLVDSIAVRIGDRALAPSSDLVFSGPAPEQEGEYVITIDTVSALPVEKPRNQSIIVSGTPPALTLTVSPADGERGERTLSGRANRLPQGAEVASVRVTAQTLAGRQAFSSTVTPAEDGSYSVVWDSRSESYGRYEVRAVATDVLGNSTDDSGSSPSTIITLRDETPPEVILVSPGDASTWATRVPLTALVEDNADRLGLGVQRVEFVIVGVGSFVADQDPSNPRRFRAEAAIPSSGDYQVFAQAEDATGNVGESERVSISVNNEVPVVTFDAPETGLATNSNVPVRVSVAAQSNVQRVEFRENGQSVAIDTAAPFEYSFVAADKADGSYTVTAIAIDANGLRGQNSRVIVVDKTPPQANISRITPSVNNVVSRGSFNVVAVANDGLSGLRSIELWAGINGAAPTIFSSQDVSSSSATATFSYDASGRSNGDTIAFYAIAVDAAGNRSPVPANFTTVTVQDLSVAITSPESGATLRGTVDVRVATSGSVSRVRLLANGTPVATRSGGVEGVFSFSVDTTNTEIFPTDGNYDFVAVAETLPAGDPDAEPDVSVSSAPVRVNVNNRALLVRWITPFNNQQFEVGSTVPLTVEVSDNIGVESVEFRIGGTRLGVVSEASNSRYSFAWDSSGLAADESYLITATATDSSGQSSTEDITVRLVSSLDTTAPVISWVSPANGVTVSGTVELLVTASDDNPEGVNRVEFFVGSNFLGLAEALENNRFSFNWNSNDFPDGSATLRAVAIDPAGNDAEANISVTVANEDTTAPQVTWLAPFNNQQFEINSSVTLRAEASDDRQLARVEFLVNNSRLSSQSASTDGEYSTSWPTTNLSAGNYTLTVRAIDAAGNQDEETISVALVERLDTTPPTISWRQPAAGSTVSGTVSLSVIANDNEEVNRVEFFAANNFLGTGSRSGTDTFTFAWDSAAFPDGTVSLRAVAVDNAGNRAEASLSVTVRNDDTTLPTVTWLEPFGGQSFSVGSTISLRVRATDNVAVDRVIFSASSGVSSIEIGQSSTANEDIYSFNWDTAGRVPGDYIISAVAVDTSGNRSSTANVNITLVDPVTIPDISLSLNVSRIEPDPISPRPAGCASGTMPCYEGSITIPVNVEDPTGTARVRLVVSSNALGTAPLAEVLDAFPYTFNLNTSDYPNGDVLRLRAEATVDVAGNQITASSNTIEIAVFNFAPQPTLAVNSPSNNDTISGIVNVNVSISSLTNSDFTLDINGDGSVGANEGFSIDLIDFTGEIVDTRSINTTTGVSVFTERSGSYETPSGFNTIQVANDIYVLRVRLPIRLRTATAGTVSAVLERTINVRTDNTNLVPPSLLILSPTNEDPNNCQRGQVLTVAALSSLGGTEQSCVKTIRDRDNAYVTVQATDDNGLAFVELRVFRGNIDDDSTPSRFVASLGGATAARVSLPINFNANPFLPNNNPVNPVNPGGISDVYTVRMVAEDEDGNRTFQDLRIRVARDDPEAPRPYSLPRLTNSLGNIVDIVPQNTVVFGRVEGGRPGDAYDHFVRLPGDPTFTPIDDTTASTSPDYELVLSDTGGYTFRSQVTTPNGDIYITNSRAIAVP